MKIDEVTGGLQAFTAQIRVAVDGAGSSVCAIGIRAGDVTDARRLLSKCYGKSNVLSVTRVVISEEESLKQVTKVRDVTTQPIASQYKHRLAQQQVIRQLLRASNIVKPSASDIEIAKNVVARRLKRVDFERQKDIEQKLRLQNRQARRRHPPVI
jgi:hypothetical protein